MRKAFATSSQLAQRRLNHIHFKSPIAKFSSMQDGPKPSPDFRSDEIHTRIDNTEKTVSLTFQLLSEFHTMNRSYDEKLDRSLQRFAITCRSKLQKSAKKATKASKKNKGEAHATEAESNAPKPAILMFEGVECDTTVLKNYDLKTGMQVMLDDLNFTFVTNPPTVLALTTYPRSVVYVGCPIVPQVSIEFGDDYECMWAVESSPRSGAFEIVSHDKIFTPTAAALNCRVKVFCHAIQSTLERSERSRTGRSVVFYLSGTVQAAPEQARDFNRMLSVREDFARVQRASQPHTATGFYYLDNAASTAASSTRREADEVRLVTYNILAEPFATSEQAYTTLYPYCEQEVLQSEFRIQRILVELLACDADIVCLQECDLRTFESYLLPILGLNGYSGHFTCKGSTEGCAVFTRNAAFRVVQRVDLPLKNVLRDAAYLDNLYAQRPDLRDVIGGKLGTVAQITVLQSTHRPSHAVVVANTHLFYHPLASFLRAIQAFAITEALSVIKSAIELNGLEQDFVKLVNAEETNQLALDKEARLAMSLLPISAEADEEVLLQGPMKATVMLLGDLNSSPNIAAMQFLTNGFATEDQLNHVWEEVKHFFWGDREANFNFVSIHDHKEKRKRAEEERAKALKESGADSAEVLAAELNALSVLDSAGLQPVLTHKLGLFSSGGYAPYSNYTPSFKQLLDYVLVQESCFEVVRVAPMPSDEVFAEFTALPSAVIPSDHVSIAVDLRWK